MPVNEAVLFVIAMGAVILFCRAFPLLFFTKAEIKTEKNGTKPTGREIFLGFVEKTVPPAAMTVLAFNAMGAPFWVNITDGLFVLIASVITALLHIWKGNPLVSIFGGTALYMVLIRVVG